MFNTILVCSDGSKPALHGAYLAAQIARKFTRFAPLLHFLFLDNACDNDSWLTYP